MNKQSWGTALHTLLDGGKVTPADRAALRMVADDIECCGIGGPLETELHYASDNDLEPETRDFARRLLGSVKKWNASRTA